MNKQNAKWIKAQFESSGGDITFVIEWRKSNMYGYNAALLVNRQKVDLASGCGYAKDTAMIENLIAACIGRYVSLGGNRLDCEHGPYYESSTIPRLETEYVLDCMYDGSREAGYHFYRKVQ